MNVDLALKDKIVRHAESLVADAALLRDNGRHRTSIALSIIAIEECGKLWQLEWIASGIESFEHRATANHRVKQSIFGFMVISAELEDWFVEVQATLLREAAALEAEDDDTRQAAINTAMAKAGFTGEKLVERISRDAYPHGMRHAHEAISGMYQDLKHACLYIDHGKADPLAALGSEDELSSAWLERARKCLEITSTKLDMAKPMRAMIEAMGEESKKASLRPPPPSSALEGMIP